MDSTLPLTKASFKVGDFITDFDHIYKIFGKEKKPDYRGDIRLYFLYRPVNSQEKTASSSIPVDNLEKCGFRHLVDSKEINNFYHFLKSPLKKKELFDLKTIKEILYLNDLGKIIYLLKQLSQNSKESVETINSIINKLAQEFAFVTQKNPLTIEKKIHSLLN